MLSLFNLNLSVEYLVDTGGVCVSLDPVVFIGEMILNSI